MIRARDVLAAPIHVYQWVGGARVPHCRYWPSCSTYTLEALEVHGAVRGGWLALRRLSRCHPWSAGGIDPVPRSSAR